MDRIALAAHLVRSAQAIHVEDERLANHLREVRRTRVVSPEQFEALVSGIQAANRCHAGTLLMLAEFLEDRPEAPTGSAGTP